MSSCHATIPNFEFDRELIDEAVANNRLLSVEIEFSRRCNFRCPYCYVPGDESLQGELTCEEIQEVVRQAKDMGARKVIVLGGEPMIFPGILGQLALIRDQGLEVEVFTNGCNIDRQRAERLFAMGVNMVLKFNSFDPATQDTLAGVKDAHRTIATALENLKAAGYPSEHAILAVSTVICRQNYAEIPRLWQWLRDQKILPYIEMITPQGNANDNGWLEVPTDELRDLFERLARIDREKYGQEWEPQPPLVGNACLRHGFSCLVKSTGEVMPCVGIPISVGNVRETPLRAIIEDSEVIQERRSFPDTIKGPCAACENACEASGCRGAAYNMTGD
jgi:MoaA/NifB/PqqE/SkfB family radical SAM enzyme